MQTLAHRKRVIAPQALPSVAGFSGARWKEVKPAIKFEVIYKYKEKYSISMMCRFFDVSRSGYYCFLKRRGKPDKNAELISEIAEIQSKTRKTYGYRRMQIALEKQGIHRNPKTILRLMRKHGLLSEIRRPRKYRYAKEHLHRYDNILNRDFTATRPNEKWVTDISYIHTKEGVLYLSIIRDLYDRSIVSYKTATSQTVQLVLDTIHEAKEKKVVTGELQLHSDQGLQYTSHAYFNLTKEYNIIPSMSRRGNCLDNAVAENFFGILKTECIYRQKLDSFQQANDLIDDYIYFYNRHRIQTKTKLTPHEMRCQFVA